MPALTPEDRIRMLGYMNYACNCGRWTYKDYCRQCDEFLFLCTPGCPHNNMDHEGHRRYPREERNMGEEDLIETPSDIISIFNSLPSSRDEQGNPR